MSAKGWIILAFVFVALLVAYDGFYTVDETEQVVVTQFGKVVGQPKTTPGLKMKLPFIQKAESFPKNLQEWDGDAGEIPTKDKTFIWVDTFARWKVSNPKQLIETLKDMDTARARLNESINSKVRDAIASTPLIDVVRTSNRELEISDEWGGPASEQSPLGDVKLGRKMMMEDVRKEAGKDLAQYGIELVDVKIKRLNYIESVRRTVYNRMIAERQQMAEKYRSEGLGEAQKIRGDKEKKLKEITSLAYKTAQEKMGKADAEATAIYAKAYNADPEFYTFLKTLDVYKSTLGPDSTVVLSTDSEFLRYLKGPREGKQ